MEKAKEWSMLERQNVAKIASIMDNFSQETQEVIYGEIAQKLGRGVGGVKVEIDRQRELIGLKRLRSGHI